MAGAGNFSYRDWFVSADPIHFPVRQPGGGGFVAFASRRAAGCERVVPLRAQPHVSRRTGADWRASSALSEQHPLLVPCMGGYGISFVGDAVRGADAAKQ